MTHIHHQTNAIHFANHLPSHAGNTGVFRLITPCGQQRLVIITQLHEPRAQTMHNFHKPDIIFNRARVLKPEKNSRAIARTGTIDIFSSQAFHD